jgi:D-aminopeptidase
MRRSGLVCAVGVIPVLLVVVPLVAQSSINGTWEGTVTFADGAVEKWVMRLSGTSNGGEGYLLLAGGRGLLMRDVRTDDRVTFDVVSSDLPRGFTCSLDHQGDDLVGACNDETGVEVADLSFRVAPEHAGERAERPRAREAGLVVGVFPTGTHNAITDVAGVRVGHVTLRSGGGIRTGVTAIIPAPGDLYRRPVPGWIHTVNGYGKLIGETQVREFGELETPILLTCTLCVWSAARGLAWALMEGDPEGEHTINPVVGETNDSWVNDMWQDPVQREHVEEALRVASSGPVAEGSVGAGTGTGAFGWKGGIGTSSRLLPRSLGGYTVGVLVQTNFGGNLTMNGAPVGRELGTYMYKDALRGAGADKEAEPADGGSLMIVVATDAPLEPMALKRLAERAIFGAVRTGSFAHNSSGDYVIAFSTAESVRRVRSDSRPRRVESLPNPQMSPLFAAVAEATEEAIYNAMFKATTVIGRDRVYEPIPLGPTLEILERYGVLNQDRKLPGS